MKHRLRHFENNFQMVASLGWIIALLSLVFLVIERMPGFLLLTLIGAIMILWQSRGKRIVVDTDKRIIKRFFKTSSIKNPSQVFIIRVRVSQNVNSRVSTTNVKTNFYKGYLMDGKDEIEISSNRKEMRDMDKLKAIASELGVPFTQNY